MNRLAVASAALAAASLVLLVPTFNALSSSGITPSEPPFRLDDPPPFTPPENPPPMNPEDGGEGDMELPFQPPCNETRQYEIFTGSVSGGGLFMSSAETDYRGEPFETHEWHPDTTLGVVWGFEMRDFAGEFRVTIYRDGVVQDEQVRNPRGSILGTGEDDSYQTEEPLYRESLNDTWTFDWVVENGQGFVGVAIYGIEPDCDAPEGDDG